MRPENPYLFTSARLGFRNWKEADLDELCTMNSDSAVMEYFPAQPSQNDNTAFISRMQKEFAQRGYCYFAVELLERGEFIGFTGLSEQHFEADFTPCVDLGWRLKRKFWGRGYATEGAEACLHYGFHKVGLEEIFSLAPVVNTRSVAVMERIGMERLRTFEHPKLLEDQRLKACVLYRKRTEGA